MTQSAKRWLLNLIKVGVSASLLLFILSKIDVKSTWEAISAVNPFLLLLGGLLFVSVVVFDATRLILFFRSTKGEVKDSGLTFDGVVRVSKVNLASLAVANVGFGTIGSEVFKVAAFQRHFGSYAAAAGAIVGIRLFAVGVTASLLFVSFSVVMLTYSNLLKSVVEQFFIQNWLSGSSLTVVALLTIIGGILVIKSDRVRAQLSAALGPFKHRSWHQYFELLIISTAIEFVRLSSLLVFVTAFDVTLSFWVMLFISTISTLLILLPISWNGLGIREASVAGLLAFFGVDWQIATAIAITSRVMMIFMSLFGVLFLSKASSGESL